MNKYVEDRDRLIRNLTEPWAVDLKPSSNQGLLGYIFYYDLGVVDPVMRRLERHRRLKRRETVKLAINLNSNDPYRIEGVSFFPSYCCHDRLLGVAHGDCAEQE